MCVEKTPWEKVIEFHGHTCPDIALGFRVSQIASRELGVRPSLSSELMVTAETLSCALDALQVLNQTTLGRGNLILNERGKQVYYFQYSGSNEVVKVAINAEILKQVSSVAQVDNPRAKQNKTLEAIQYILGCEENSFCTVSKQSGNLSKEIPPASWSICSVCGEAVKSEFAILKEEQVFCPDCNHH